MKTSFLVNLGNQLTKIRESTGLNQGEFFDKYLSGTERGRKLKAPKAKGNYMSAVENGKKEIPYEMLLKYSEIGNVSVDMLLKGEEFIPQKREKNERPFTLSYALQNLFSFCDLYTHHETATDNRFYTVPDGHTSICEKDYLQLAVKEEPLLDEKGEPVETENGAKRNRLTISFIPERWEIEYGSYLYAALKEVLLEWQAVMNADRVTTAVKVERLWRESMLKKGEKYTVYGYKKQALDWDDPISEVPDNLPEMDKVYSSHREAHTLLTDRIFFEKLFLE